MVTLLSLWLPILISAVAVFFTSFVMWMILPHHKGDWKKLPDEDAVHEALRAQDAPPGQYTIPWGDKESWKDPEFMKKCEEGPSGMLIVRPRGGFAMGKSMAQSTVFNLVISVLVAYVASFTLEKAASGSDVFRLTSIVALLAYAGALGWGPIWWSRTWSSTLREMFDGAVYGIVTGAVFMGLWP